MADLLYTEPVRYTGTEISSGFWGVEGGESLIPCGALPAETAAGFVVRMHETMGRRGSAMLKLAPGMFAERVDLSGKPVSGGVCPLEFRPYEIVSVLIRS
ncbi:MAG: hypothetical protein OHK005_12760 [Candidatus Methylacidiphilales bacterium]